MGNLHTHFPQAVDWLLSWTWSFPGGSTVKNLPASAGDVGLILGLGRYPGEENDYPHQCSCLENSMHRGVWWATARGVTKNQTWLSTHAHTHTHTHTHTHKLNMHWELQETQQKTAAGTPKNRTDSSCCTMLRRLRFKSHLLVEAQERPHSGSKVMPSSKMVD